MRSGGWIDLSRGPGPASSDDAGELIFFLPDYVPEGVETGKGSLHRDERQPASYAAVLGRPDNGSYRDVVSVAVHEARGDRDVSPEERRRHEIVRIHGEPARLDSLEALGVHLDWFKSGLAIRVSGDTGSRRLVIQTARSLALPASGDANRVRFSSIPEGQELVGESRLPALRVDSYRLDLSPTGGSPRAGGITVYLFREGKASPAIYGAVFADRVRFKSVRGADAAIGNSEADSVEGQSVHVEQAAVAWLEHPDLLVAVAGTISEDDAIRVAESLKQVTEDEWRDQIEVRES